MADLEQQYPPYVDLLRLVGVVYSSRGSTGAVVHRAFAIARSGAWLKLSPRVRTRLRRNVTTQRLPRTPTATFPAR